MSARLEIGSGSPQRCYELTVFSQDLVSLGDEWPVGRGAIRWRDGNRAELLHFAPGRWLVPDPDAALVTRLNELGPARASVVDVSGKWHVLHLSAEHAWRALHAQISVERILSDRGCAALALFDCPCLLAARSGSFDVWTHASYVACLRQALEHAHQRFADCAASRGPLR